jgi:hypothetical protein
MHNELSLSQLLWRYCWPFWLFKDASVGSNAFVRAAAYRHNREKRIYLPGYLVKWAFICAFAWASTTAFEALAASAEVMRPVFIGIAASFGMLIAFGACVMFVTAYAYFYLSRHET